MRIVLQHILADVFLGSDGILSEALGFLVYALLLEIIILSFQYYASKRRVYLYFQLKHVRAAGFRILFFLTYAAVAWMVGGIVTHIQHESLHIAGESVYLLYALASVGRSALLRFTSEAVLVDTASLSPKDIVTAISAFNRAKPEYMDEYRSIQESAQKIRKALSDTGFLSHSALSKISEFVVSGGVNFYHRDTFLWRIRQILKEGKQSIGHIEIARLPDTEVIISSIEAIYDEVVQTVPQDRGVQIEGLVREYFLLRVARSIEEDAAEGPTYAIQGLLVRSAAKIGRARSSEV